MGRCLYYALEPDCVLVLDFIFSNPGWRLIDSVSRRGEQAREFRNTSDVLAVRELLKRPERFALHAPEMGGQVTTRRDETGETFHYRTEGWGLIHLDFPMLKGDLLEYASAVPNSEAWARAYEDLRPSVVQVAAWDWAAIRRVSDRLNRFIRKVAVAKRGVIAVLPAAHEAQLAGHIRFNIDPDSK